MSTSVTAREATTGRLTAMPDTPLTRHYAETTRRAAEASAKAAALYDQAYAAVFNGTGCIDRDAHTRWLAATGGVERSRGIAEGILIALHGDDADCCAAAMEAARDILIAEGRYDLHKER